MIAIDTSILLRLFLEDDTFQAEQVEHLLQAGRDSYLVSTVVIAEMAWVLRSYGYGRDRIADAIDGILAFPNLVFTERDVVGTANVLYRRGKADFGDYLILAQARHRHVDSLVSFDMVLCREQKDCITPDEYINA